ncbi:MAG TPA: diacylglycerol kinase family protein [Solirubrobacteraceae bacterium]|nr:diacylglycerol kinase family protein [Solirubrobacteraceae bacterium]
MSRAVSLIVNPNAGGGKAAEVLPAVEAALRGHGFAVRVTSTRDLPHACELAGAAVQAGEIAATLGGDGLVGCVAGQLAGGDGVLGVLPGGRGNDFARVLGIPADPVEACATLAGGVERLIDVGEVNGSPFIGVASFGLDSDANRLANETKLIKGNLVYLYAGIRSLASWVPARFELALDGGERVAFVGSSVALANSKAYGGGMFIAPDAELDDGLLDVVMTGRAPKRRLLFDHTRKLFAGGYTALPAVRVVRAREVLVSADRPFTVYADGDPIAELPATVRVRHRALRVLAPAG